MSPRTPLKEFFKPFYALIHYVLFFSFACVEALYEGHYFCEKLRSRKRVLGCVVSVGRALVRSCYDFRSALEVRSDGLGG